MRAVMPLGLELPDNVKPVKMEAPPGEHSVNIKDIVGLVHLDDDGNPLGFEFMFELDKKEVQVLRHEPYLTISFYGQGVMPFNVETTVPHDKKYDSLATHSHVCSLNLSHETNRWWQCDNPAHDSKGTKLRSCAECVQLQGEAEEQGELDAEEDA